MSLRSRVRAHVVLRPLIRSRRPTPRRKRPPDTADPVARTGRNADRRGGRRKHTILNASPCTDEKKEGSHALYSSARAGKSRSWWPLKNQLLPRVPMPRQKLLAVSTPRILSLLSCFLSFNWWVAPAGCSLAWMAGWADRSAIRPVRWWQGWASCERGT